MNNIVQDVPVPGGDFRDRQKVINPDALENWIDDTDRQLDDMSNDIADIRVQMYNLCKSVASLTDRLSTPEIAENTIDAERRNKISAQADRYHALNAKANQNLKDAKEFDTDQLILVLTVSELEDIAILSANQETILRRQLRGDMS